MSDSFFLRPEEVSFLTGYERLADQRRWLLDRKWKFEESATGRPIVCRAYAESRMSGKAQKIEPVLNLDRIRKAA